MKKYLYIYIYTYHYVHRHTLYIHISMYTYIHTFMTNQHLNHVDSMSKWSPVAMCFGDEYEFGGMAVLSD